MRIAINGAGVAGPTLAYWLRRSGHEPVLYEKAPAPRTGGYLIDFWGLGYEVAERMGLIPILRQRCYLMERMRMVDRHGREEAGLDLGPIRELLQGRFISLARTDITAALLGACQAVPVHFGVWVTAIDQDGDGVTVTLSSGQRERFDLLIGADGLHSLVRELVFGPERQFERSLDCHVAAFHIRGYPRREERTYVSHTVPKRHVARVTLRDDETLVLLVCRAALIDGDPPREQQKAALRRAFGDMTWEVPEILDHMDRADDVYFDRVSQIHLPRWASGRVALLGDAAACPSFLAGEGTGLAMIEAYVVAGELHRAGGDLRRALAAYDARLRSFVSAKQDAALRFRGFFAPNTALALTLRNLAVNALSLRPFAKRFLARSVHDNLELPEYVAV
jgi:2-polyprenyl-6-methoxyphenol hydroxylase-like FAD-dependent oxidoreductase